VAPARTRVNAKAFYERGLSEAERESLKAARKVEGLEQEIAMLRVRLLSTLQEHPADFQLLLAGVGMLVRAVAAQYRLSPKAAKDLANRMKAVLDSLGDQLLPPDR
jgi:hypothetical protein